MAGAKGEAARRHDQHRIIPLTYSTMPEGSDLLRSSAARLARNPLGIFALFILLMHSVSTVAGALIPNLDPTMATIFAIYVVGFPVLILFSFMFLVIFHHEKLYAPGDFEDQQHFVDMVQNQRNMGRAVRELREFESYEQVDPDPDPGDAHTAVFGDPAMDAPAESADDDLPSLYLVAETLALDRFEQETGYPLRRNISFPVVIEGRRDLVPFDAAYLSDDAITAIEVILIRRPSTATLNRFVAGKLLSAQAVGAWLQQEGHRENLRIWFVVVVRDASPAQRVQLEEELRRIQARSRMAIEWKVYPYEDLHPLH